MPRLRRSRRPVPTRQRRAARWTQTGEFDAGEEIRAWKSAETAGSFLAVSSGKETDTELRIWNTDTGELIYDSTAEGEIENEKQ